MVGMQRPSRVTRFLGACLWAAAATVVLVSNQTPSASVLAVQASQLPKAEPWKTVPAAYDRISRNWAQHRPFPWPFVSDWLAAGSGAERLLVAGCGDGRNVAAALETERYSKVLGMDISSGMLAAARQRLGPEAVEKAELLQGDVCQLPLKSESCEAILSCAVLHHLPAEKTLAALGEFARVLTSHGRLLASAWDPRARAVTKRGRPASASQSLCAAMSTWGAQSNVQSAHKELTCDPQIEQWKVRRLIRQLETAKGAGTSMISLLIPPKYDISRTNKMLTEEYGTAAGIKSHQNRLSVLAALTSTQQRLKLYSKIPDNGLVIYCGETTTEEGKAKRLTIDFEPFKPIHRSMYWCDSKFHTEDLAELLESDEKFGFLIIDGNGTLYGTVAGSHREVLHRFSVDLPKKHSRGGQSALRFARLRLEKRHNYLRKVSEIATQIFITDARPNVSGLIIAGSADFKTELMRSDLWDKRLDAVIMRPLLDVAYGGENGFNQAIELASDTLRNVKFVLEKQLLSRFFSEVAQDSGRYCFGLQETLRALEMGAVETLILWENLEVRRLLLRSTHSSGSGDLEPEQEQVLLLSPAEAQEARTRNRGDSDTGAELDLEVVENVAFIEWAVERHRSFGARLEFVTDRSQEGSQFCKGFGGVGGLLRYRVEFEAPEEPGQAEESDEDFM